MPNLNKVKTGPKIIPIPEWAVDLYRNGETLTEVARMIGRPYSTVRFALIRYGIEIRSIKEALIISRFDRGGATRGKKRPRFSDTHRTKISASLKARGGRGFSERVGNYIQITMGPNKGRGQHVVIMERLIGRRIERHEVVHHVDEDKHNNTPSNLQLMTRKEHARHHATTRHYAKS